MDAVSALAAAGGGVVSQRSFQALLARLVIDPDFRDRVGADGAAALDGDLTTVERERVMSVVFDKGLDATRTLHKSFRLTKIYTLLPMTRTLLGPHCLAREIGSFWKSEPPVSHYFLEEAVAFCDFLQNRIRSGLRRKYLEEVVAYERANLELLRDRPSGELPDPQFVRFGHDPETLFTQLINGKRPRAISARTCLLVGSIGDDGDVQWRISDVPMADLYGFVSSRI